MADSEEVDYSLANPDTLTKYKLAGEISGKVLEKVKAACVAGALVIDICVLGDKLLEEETAKIYKGKKISKGIAFPTSISPNNIATHMSPLPGEPESELALADNDVVKISLGAHIDGFGGILADTIVVGQSGEITGRVADVFNAAWLASEAAIRSIKAGAKNWDVTDNVLAVANAFETKPLEDMLSHSQERNVVDGSKRIILNPSEGKKKAIDSVTFEEGEVWGLDILVTTGDGKTKKSEAKTTIYKKTGNTYSLKLKSARSIFSDIQKRFGPFPFTTRALEEEKSSRMGIRECTQHELLIAYDVYEDKKGETVVQYFTTVALTKNGIIKIAGPATPDLTKFKTDKVVTDEELLKVISAPLKTNSKKNKKKKSKTTAAGETTEAAEPAAAE
ncbi:peptidase M24, structural domain-containing protein [Myxozyma melibiosi]|uniref:Peptidase M24, structural domain-containing protein n=1 Tax=Myxozyma melibiosi TaxID=54550 RepID=A0ABR1F5B1_9ASCO